MAQDAHKDKGTFVAAYPQLKTMLTPALGLDALASQLGWSRDRVQEVTRELGIH